MTTGYADPDTYPEPDPEAEQASRLAYLRTRLFDSAGLERIPAPDPVIDGYLYANTLGWLTGKQSSCKSFLALDMAGCVGAGMPWHGQPVKQGRVLYLVAEGWAGVRQRVRSWEEHWQTPMANVTWLPGPMNLVGDATALAMLAEEDEATLVVCDTQAMMTVGLDEVSSKDMGLIIRSAETIRERSGACVLLVHHEAVHGTRPRGHSSMDGAATSMLRVVKDGDVVWCGNTKQKDGPAQPTLSFQVHIVGASLVLVPADVLGRFSTDSEKIVYKALQDMERVKGGASSTDLRDAVADRGVVQSTYYWAMKRLVTAGLVLNKGKGRQTWYVTVDPNQGVLGEGE